MERPLTELRTVLVVTLLNVVPGVTVPLYIMRVGFGSGRVWKDTEAWASLSGTNPALPTSARITGRDATE